MQPYPPGCKPPGRAHKRSARHDARATANFPTNIMDFRRFDSSIILILRGGILMSREFPGKFESSNLSSRDNVREIGRRASYMYVYIYIYIYIYVYT